MDIPWCGVTCCVELCRGKCKGVVLRGEVEKPAEVCLYECLVELA